MFGVQIPRNHREAMELDVKNGHTKWRDAEQLEISQLQEYNTFKTCGHTPPDGYKLINVHIVYAVKHDGRHKARIVAGGHLTGTPTEPTYSGVVGNSQCTLKIPSQSFQERFFSLRKSKKLDDFICLHTNLSHLNYMKHNKRIH
jgi:hypothetical protein